MVVAFTSRDHTSGIAQPSVTDDSGDGVAWTQVHSSTDRKAQLWAKFVTAGFLLSATSISASGCVGSTAAVLKCFSGSEATVAAAFDAIVEEANASNNETHVSYSPAVADEMILAFIYNYNNDNAVTSLSFATLGATTMTERLSTGGLDCAIAFGHALQSGGPTATGTLTWAQTNGVTYSVVVGLKPPAVAGRVPFRSPYPQLLAQ